MKKSANITGSSGFTIIELLISTTILSLILLTASFTILEISRLYYKGIVLTRTQDAARTLLEGVSQPIQYEDSVVNDLGYIAGKGVICIGRTRYTYALNKKQPSDIRHVVWRDSVDSPALCGLGTPVLGAATPSINGKDMLTDDMRITEFDVTPDPEPGLYSVSVTVMYGYRDLMIPLTPITDTPTGCNGAIAGSQWCAKASYHTKVYKRIKGTDI